MQIIDTIPASGAPPTGEDKRVSGLAECTDTTAMRVASARETLCLERASCCVCGEEAGSVPVGVGEDFEYRTSVDTFLAMQCEGCGLVYLDPRPAESELARIYPEDYHAFDFSAERFGFVYKVRRRLEARRALRWCEGLGNEARIIDVGCGDGFHLRLLREFGRPGWRLEGIDPSRRAVEAAAHAGISVREGTVECLDLPASTYDLVLLVATVEHVADPVGLLRAVHVLLKPGGRAVVITDNTDTLDFKLFGGRHWGGYHFPRHWNLFNPRALRLLAEKTGFEVHNLSTIVSPVNWVYSVRNMLDDLGAPAWLVNRFSLRSPVSLAAFTVIDTFHQLAGQGALLRAVLRRPI